MVNRSYTKFQERELILREHLALDRTILANERTFLGYIRTSLTLFVVGVTFIKFFNILFLAIMGWIFILVGILIFIFGLIKYVRTKNQINSVK